jgi:hypothetical protein
MTEIHRTNYTVKGMLATLVSVWHKNVPAFHSYQWFTPMNKTNKEGSQMQILWVNRNRKLRLNRLNRNQFHDPSFWNLWTVSVVSMNP